MFKRYRLLFAEIITLMSHPMDGCFIIPNNLSKIILTIWHDLAYFYLNYYVFLVAKQT